MLPDGGQALAPLSNGNGPRLRAPHRGRFRPATSFILLQLPLAPMGVFPIGIERAGLVAMDRPQHRDARQEHPGDLSFGRMR
jgi:hypothetical protein